MPSIENHPLRYALTNELHARPFPSTSPPAQAAFLAFKMSDDAAKQDRERNRACLLALLDRFGSQHPTPDATHFFGGLGKHQLKWEQHTEFVTYTIFTDSVSDRAFDPSLWEVFPDDWLAEVPGVCITSAHLRIVQKTQTEAEICAAIDEWFVPESLAASTVLDQSAIIAGDFRIDASGHMRFAIFADPATGPRRVGRIVQRVCEIETYKAMSMLGLPCAQKLSRRMGPLDEGMSKLVDDMTGDLGSPDETLSQLLSIAADLENLMAQTSFRFGATGAYEAIVNQRISVMREERYEGRQTFSEFMMRRFDPAMRTVNSTERRLQSLTDRALRAGNLLRTRVDVERSAQNQDLLESMDQRAALQLRLQKTVEGLSVVAISYYAVNLMVYLAAPLAEQTGLGKTWLTGMVVLPVVALVWWTVRRIRSAVD